MFLAKVIGSVVATKKDEGMRGQKLLMLRPVLIDQSDPSKFTEGKNTLVAVDAMGAGLGELVLFCQGSSARQAAKMKTLPVDAVITGIVDSVDVQGKRVFPEK